MSQTVKSLQKSCQVCIILCLCELSSPSQTCTSGWLEGVSERCVYVCVSVSCGELVTCPGCVPASRSVPAGLQHPPSPWLGTGNNRKWMDLMFCAHPPKIPPVSQSLALKHNGNFVSKEWLKFKSYMELLHGWTIYNYEPTWKGWREGWCSGRGHWSGCWRREKAERWNKPAATSAPQPGRSVLQPGTSRWGEGSAGDAPERSAPRRRWRRLPTYTGRRGSPVRAREVVHACEALRFKMCVCACVMGCPNLTQGLSEHPAVHQCVYDGNRETDHTHEDVRAWQVGNQDVGDVAQLLLPGNDEHQPCVS